MSQLKCTVALVGKVRGLHGSTGPSTEVNLANITGTQKNIQEKGGRDTGDSGGSQRDSDRSNANRRHDTFAESCSTLREPLLDS